MKEKGLLKNVFRRGDLLLSDLLINICATILLDPQLERSLGEERTNFAHHSADKFLHLAFATLRAVAKVFLDLEKACDKAVTSGKCRFARCQRLRNHWK